MIEIRTIHENEIPLFLDLLCKVFHLNPKKVKTAFFSEPFFDIHRKWALFENGKICSILTTTPLILGIGKGIGIAGVATPFNSRNKGFAQKLLHEVLYRANNSSESFALLFAQNPKLYHHVGFQVLDEVIRAPIETRPPPLLPQYVSNEKVKKRYQEWAMEHPLRLQRDQKRWEFWGYIHKPCESYKEGYLCLEGKIIREVVSLSKENTWPAPKGTQWIGLRSLTKLLEVPIQNEKSEMLLMGKGLKEPPQMFMTDQF